MIFALKVTILFKSCFGLLRTEFWSEYLNIAHEASLYLGLKGCIDGIAKKLFKAAKLLHKVTGAKRRQ